MISLQQNEQIWKEIKGKFFLKTSSSFNSNYSAYLLLRCQINKKIFYFALNISLRPTFKRKQLVEIQSKNFKNDL